MPTLLVSDSGVSSSAAKPTTTVMPDVITATPAVANVRTAAACGLRPGVQLFAKPRHDQQRIVDADAEADHRDHVEHEHRHRRVLGEDADDRERDRDRPEPDDHRDECRDQRAERQHEDRQRDRDQVALVAVRVLGTDLANVDVQRRSPGHQHAVGFAVGKMSQHALERVAQRLTTVATESRDAASETRKNVVRLSWARNVESCVVRTDTTPRTHGSAFAVAISESSSCPATPSVIGLGPCTVTAKNSETGRENASSVANRRRAPRSSGRRHPAIRGVRQFPRRATPRKDRWPPRQP